MSAMPYNLQEMADIFVIRKSCLKNPAAFKPDSTYELIMNQSCAFYFSIDFSRMEYLFLSSGVKKVLGYEREEWLSQGLSFAFGILHPEDREVLRTIHMDIMKEWQNTLPGDRQNISFSFDFRVFSADGKIVRLNQHTVFVEVDADGAPLVDFSVCTDITSLKATGPSSLLIKFYNSDKPGREKQLFYTSKPNTTGLSIRELDIIKLLILGLSSKQISQRLNISEHTIRTHRKNILKKTNCNSTVELISLANEKGLLQSSSPALKKKMKGPPDIGLQQQL